MNSFWKGFSSLFDWMVPRTVEEQLNDLDNQMQVLYDRMGWGSYVDQLQEQYNKFGWGDTNIDKNRILELQKLYNLPNHNCSYISATDINRILEAEKDFQEAIDDYIYYSRKSINKVPPKKSKIDPARPRINKYL